MSICLYGFHAELTVKWNLDTLKVTNLSFKGMRFLIHFC